MSQPPQTKLEAADLIARVLSYQPGFTDPDPVVAEHLRYISDRYNDLKMRHSFEESSRIAKSEWVLRVLEEMP